MFYVRLRHEHPINFPYPLALVAVRIKATDQLSGIIDNFNCVATSIVKDYDPTLPVEEVDSTGSTFNRGDFTATNAFLWSSLDISPYAGTDLGSTPYYIELLDAAGKKATGYLAGPGAGETLGSEELVNPGFDPDTSGWIPYISSLASIIGGQVGKCLEITKTESSPAQVYQNIAPLIPVALYKQVAYVKSGSSGNEAFNIRIYGDGNYIHTYGISSNLWVPYSLYYNPGFYDPFSQCALTKNTTTDGTMLFDEANLKRVTDPPSTAVHIVSSLNGTVRNWASVESGFDPNTISSWQIYKFGAWFERPTNNPASLYRYVLQGAPNTKPQADAKLDLGTPASFFEDFWQWCSDNNFAYNAVTSTAKSVFDQCVEICSAGRCSPQRIDGRWAGVIDRPRTLITGHYTPHNSWNLEFGGTFPQLPHGIRVAFIDETNGYQQQERIVYDDGYNEDNATLFEAIAQQGVTNPDQIYKLWRYNIACTKLRPFPFSFMVDWEHLTNTRGDLIRVGYYELSGQLFSGRIRGVEEVDGNHVLTLDNTVIMVVGKSYAIRIRLQDGTTLTGDVLTEEGETNIITIDGLLAQVPNGDEEHPSNDLFQFGELQAESIPAIIKSIEPVDKLCAKITCLDYAPGVFNADTELIPEWNPIVTLPYLADNRPSVPEITNIISDESVVQRDPGGRFRFRIAVNFRHTSSRKVNAQYVQCQYALVTESTVYQWQTIENVSALAGVLFIPDVQEAKQYQIRLRALTNTGISSEWSTPYLETVIGRTSIPDNVTGLSYSFTENGALLTWDRLDHHRH